MVELILPTVSMSGDAGCASNAQKVIVLQMHKVTGNAGDASNASRVVPALWLITYVYPLGPYSCRRMDSMLFVANHPRDNRALFFLLLMSQD